MNTLIFRDNHVEPQLYSSMFFDRDELKEIRHGGCIWWKNSTDEIRKNSIMILESILLIAAIALFGINVLTSLNKVNFHAMTHTSESAEIANS